MTKGMRLGKKWALSLIMFSLMVGSAFCLSQVVRDQAGSAGTSGQTPPISSAGKTLSSLSSTDAPSSPFDKSPAPVGATDVGHLSEGSVNVDISFGIRNEDQFQQLLKSVETPGDSKKNYITEGDFESQHAPVQSNYDQVVSFLEQNAMTVTQTSADRLLILAKGGLKNAEQAFGEKVDLYHYGGETFYMNTRDTVIPALQELGVTSVMIDNLTAQPCLSTLAGASNNSEVTASPLVQSGTPVLNANPQTLWQVYMGGTYNNDSGSGETIGIVDDSDPPTLQSDLNLFDKFYGIPNFTLTVEDNGITPTLASSIETATDVEWAHAMAPGAAIELEFASDGSVDGICAAANELIEQNNHPNPISISWGFPEGPWVSAYTNIFATAAAEGIQVFAGSGDYGAYNLGQTLSVNYPASDPNVIGVGGTTLYENGSSYYETGWNGSGGGYSAYFTEPYYQTVAGVPQVGDIPGFRAVPDVACDADPNSGVIVFVEGQKYSGNGTSLATCLMAGIDADSLWMHNFSLDQANLYMAYKEGGNRFYDITSGNNGYYNCGTGWDAVTGLGSIRYTNWNGFTPAPACSVIFPTPGEQIISSTTSFELDVEVQAWSLNAPSITIYVNGTSHSTTYLPSAGYWINSNILVLNATRPKATTYQTYANVTFSPTLTLTTHTITFYGLYQPGGGGGGCPNLSVWNGTGFVDQGLLNIHNLVNPDSDVVRLFYLNTTPAPILNTWYSLELYEHPPGYNNSHSWINEVSLYAVDTIGVWHLCNLDFAYQVSANRSLLRNLSSPNGFFKWAQIVLFHPTKSLNPAETWHDCCRLPGRANLLFLDSTRLNNLA